MKRKHDADEMEVLRQQIAATQLSLNGLWKYIEHCEARRRDTESRAKIIEAELNEEVAQVQLLRAEAARKRISMDYDESRLARLEEKAAAEKGERP